MSLLNFTPLTVHGRPYAIQEYNGKITNGSQDEFKIVNKTEILSMYPNLEKSKLNCLQHSISRDDMRGGFATRDSNGIQQAWDRWNQEGITGVVDHVANATETSKLWPISRLGKGILKVQNSVSFIASKVFPTLAQERIEDLLQKYGHTLDWKTSWLRCIAIHENGRRFAICQQNDYIRVYTVSNRNDSSAPLTLKHPSQQNVACMAWQIFDHRVLAVGAGSTVIIWRLTNKTFNLKPSAQCAQIIDLSVGPVTQLIWDKTSSNGLLAVTPNSSKIMVIDASNGEVDSLGAWTGGCITRIIPAPDGKQLAVLYIGNLIRVYDRTSWSSEKWNNLDGRAVDAVWSPNGDCLVFSTENSHKLFSISFTRKEIINEDGRTETKLIGESVAQPVYDVSAVEFDASELNVLNAVERPIQIIGGEVQSLSLSPDGQRLTVQFKHNPEVFALFVVDWYPVLRLIPIGLVEAPAYGNVVISQFVPQFNYGSLLCIVWSGGKVQYLPLVYGNNASYGVAGNILGYNPNNSNNFNNISLYQHSIDNSLRSVDLSMSLRDSLHNETGASGDKH